MDVDKRVDPSALTPEELQGLRNAFEREVRPALVTPDGEIEELPPALNDLFVWVLTQVRERRAVSIIPEEETLTTQSAANYLGVSRQYLVRLLDSGEVPCHRVGTHRRVFLRDLFEFRSKRDRRRLEVLDEMTREAVEHGLDDRVAEEIVEFEPD